MLPPQATSWFSALHSKHPPELSLHPRMPDLSTMPTRHHEDCSIQTMLLHSMQTRIPITISSVRGLEYRNQISSISTWYLFPLPWFPREEAGLGRDCHSGGIARLGLAFIKRGVFRPHDRTSGKLRYAYHLCLVPPLPALLLHLPPTGVRSI